MEKLYAAATLQVPNMKETYNMQICTPVLGHSRHRIKKHIDEEIETRLVRAQNGNNPKILNKLIQLASDVHLNIFYRNTLYSIRFRFAYQIMNNHISHCPLFLKKEVSNSMV